MVTSFDLLFQQKPMEKIEFWILKKEADAAIGLIDTIQLYLNKEQLLAKTTIFQIKNVQSQMFGNNSKLHWLSKRVQNMFTENAATKRQVDEVEGKNKCFKEQIKVWNSRCTNRKRSQIDWRSNS
jgi:HlyD family secretion protein